MAGWCTRHTWWTRLARQAGKDAEVECTKSRRNGFSSGSLRPFSFRRVASFSPVRLARSGKSFDEFADGIREAIKPGDSGTSFKKGRARTEKGLRACEEKDHRFQDRSKATTTFDNYLPRRISVLINNDFPFKVTWFELICEYGSSTAYWRLRQTQEKKMKICRHVCRQTYRLCG